MGGYPVSTCLLTGADIQCFHEIAESIELARELLVELFGQERQAGLGRFNVDKYTLLLICSALTVSLIPPIIFITKLC